MPASAIALCPLANLPLRRDRADGDVTINLELSGPGDHVRDGHRLLVAGQDCLTSLLDLAGTIPRRAVHDRARGAQQRLQHVLRTASRRVVNALQSQRAIDQTPDVAVSAVAEGRDIVR